MNARPLMIGSALILAALGLAASFVPRELLMFLDARPDPLPVLFVQITGGLYLGFAMLNWMAREGLIGGVYGRPVAAGHFMHFTVVALALLKALIAGPRPPVVIAGATLYWVLAVAFVRVLLTPPREAGTRGG